MLSGSLHLQKTPCFPDPFALKTRLLPTFSSPVFPALIGRSPTANNGPRTTDHGPTKNPRQTAGVFARRTMNHVQSIITDQCSAGCSPRSRAARDSCNTDTRPLRSADPMDRRIAACRIRAPNGDEACADDGPTSRRDHAGHNCRSPRPHAPLRTNHTRRRSRHRSLRRSHRCGSRPTGTGPIDGTTIGSSNSNRCCLRTTPPLPPTIIPLASCMDSFPQGRRAAVKRVLAREHAAQPEYRPSTLLTGYRPQNPRSP